MNRILVLLVLVLVTNIANCAELSVSDELYSKKMSLPSLPLVLMDSCVGEKCLNYEGAWSALEPVIVYKKRGTKSPIAFKLRKNETFRVLKQLIEIEKYGKTKILVSATELNLKKGEVIYEVVPGSEGYSLYWHKDTFFDHSFDFYDDFSNPKDAKSVSKYAKILSYPQFTEWVKIRNEKGMIGWSINASLDNGQF